MVQKPIKFKVQRPEQEPVDFVQKIRLGTTDEETEEEPVESGATGERTGSNGCRNSTAGERTDSNCRGNTGT